jgi:hypothetical protein
MKYYTRVVQNEILVEIQIACDEHPGAGYIAARKLLDIPTDGSGLKLKPATVMINVGFRGDLDLDEVDNIQRWLNEAAKMARLMDDHIKTPVDFAGVTYETRQVAGTLILDKKSGEASDNP